MEDSPIFVYWDGTCVVPNGNFRHRNNVYFTGIIHIYETYILKWTQHYNTYMSIFLISIFSRGHNWHIAATIYRILSRYKMQKNILSVSL